MYYGTISKGYKAGGVNLTLGTPNFEPEKNLVYEAGVKSTLLDERLRVNGAVFYSDYKDIQFSSLFNGAAADAERSLRRGRGRGAGSHGPLRRLGLERRPRLSRCRVRQGRQHREHGRPTCSRLVPKGADLPFSPEFTLNAGVDYDFALAGGTLTPRVQWSLCRASSWPRPSPVAATIVPSRNLLDARLTWDSGDSWQIEAFATTSPTRPTSPRRSRTPPAPPVASSMARRGSTGCAPRLNFGD